MRIALIADIHGNLIACAIVLQEVAQNAIEQIIRLGTASGVSELPSRVVCFCQSYKGSGSPSFRILLAHSKKKN